MNQVKLFGSTIKETIDALRGRSYREWDVVVYPELASSDIHHYDKQPDLNKHQKRSVASEILIKQNRIKAIMRIVITVVLLALAIYLLVTRKEGDDNSIPSVIIGAITGYWLK